MVETTPVRMSDKNHFWLLEHRGAGTMDILLDILIKHAEKCPDLKKEIQEGTRAKKIKRQ